MNKNYSNCIIDVIFQNLKYYDLPDYCYYEVY